MLGDDSSSRLDTSQLSVCGQQLSDCEGFRYQAIVVSIPAQAWANTRRRNYSDTRTHKVTKYCEITHSDWLLKPGVAAADIKQADKCMCVSVK